MAKQASKKRFWFKAKTYGLGWTPATWEGWLVTILFVIFFVDFAIRSDGKGVIVPAVVAIATLLVICYFTGEPLRWQWGEKKRKIK